ncbi:MAG: PGF-pre-PGF domain-containing protein [Methanosarcinales archaeon]|nr:PGF-pre-PGF domain-containing protein [Methanosarcinales archaeon]
MYRYNNDSWELLPTSMILNNEQDLYYQSLTPGFSPFAISGHLVHTPTIIRTSVTKPVENTSITLNDEVSVKPKPDGWNVQFLALLTILVLSLIATIYFNQDAIHKVIDNIKQRGSR